MDLLHNPLGGCGDDSEGVNDFSASTIDPLIMQTRKGKKLLLRVGDEVLLFFLPFSILPLPLIEAIRDDQASFGLPKRGFLCHSLHFCV